MNNYSSDEEKLISWFQENYKNILLGINTLKKVTK